MAKITFNQEKCKGCGLCATFCPKHLIEMDKEFINKKGHHPARITDESACVGCASCAMMCPDCVIEIER